MITALATSVVALMGFVAGYRTGDRLHRALGVLIGGLVLLNAVFVVVVVLPNPVVEEGWDGRTPWFGHQLPNWEWNLGWYLTFAWLLALCAGWYRRGTVLGRLRHRAN